MRVDPFSPNDSWEDETVLDDYGAGYDDSETHLFVKLPPVHEVPTLAAAPIIDAPTVIEPVRIPQMVTVRISEPLPTTPVPRLSPMPPRPSPRPMQVMPWPEHLPTERVRRTRGYTRRVPKVALGFGAAAVCVVIGVIIGGAIALGGSHASNASAATVPFVVPQMPKIVAMKSQPIVTPIETAPLEEPPTVIEIETPVPAPKAIPVHHSKREVGTLAVSTKPPCSISIDGKDTGLVAPQRGIALAPGKHDITLTNAEAGVQLTTEVEINAKKSTRLIRDFTD